MVREWGYSFRKPRPYHYKSDEQAKVDFQCSFPDRIKKMEEKYQRDVRVFCMDEHRMGLQPILKHEWLLPEEVDQPVSIDYKWLWVYGFVEPVTGRSHLYLMPYLNRSHFQSTIDEFVNEAKISKEKPVLVVLDNASCHRSKKVVLPEGLEFCFLPPYSLELQPIERLWPEINGSVANQLFTDFDDFIDVVEDKCRWLMKEGKEKVRSLTNFYWWKNALLF